MHNRYPKILLLLLCVFTMMAAEAQKKPGYFGKRTFFSIEKELFFGSILKGRDYTSTSVVRPILRIDKFINSRTLLGFSFRSCRSEMQDNGRYFSSEYMVAKNGKPIHVQRGYGLVKIRSNAYVLHWKKYFNRKSIAPIGRYHTVDVGIINNVITPADNYRFLDKDKTEYGIESSANESFRHLLISYSHGKTMQVFRSRVLIDISLGIELKQAFKPSFYWGKEWAGDVSASLVNRQLLKCKIGLLYAL
jgi:hypothetical protein